MVKELKIPAFPILEPLSRATSTSLRPIQFHQGDFLEVDVDKTGEHFICKAVCLRKTNNAIAGEQDVVMVQTSEGVFVKDDRYYNYPSSVASTRWFARVPERKQIQLGTWKLAGTDFTALVLHHVWPSEHVIWKSEEAVLLYTYLLKRFLVQSKTALIAATWKATQEAPTMPDDFIEHPDLPLGDYQKVPLLASLAVPAYALFMEQGTGKTAIVVNRVCLEGSRKMVAKKGMQRTLIICPRQVRRNWEKEFERFATVPGKVVALRGGKTRKIKELVDAVRTESDCCWSASIISLDSVDSIWDALGRIKWDLVVIDESHKIKNPNTKRFKTVIKIDDLRAASKMILTGTPITNTAFDLWAQFEWLGKGLSGFTTYKNFKEFHGKWDTRKNGDTAVQRLIGFKAIPLIQERLARLSFLIRKKDANLGLPEKVYDIYETSMTPVQAEIYKQVATRLVLEIDSLLAESKATGKTLTTDHILTKLLRLAQICSGFIKTDDMPDYEAGEMVKGDTMQIGDRNPKIEALIDIMREQWETDKNCKFLVWCCFIPDMKAISSRLAEEGIGHVGYHKVIHPDYKVGEAEDAEYKINFDEDCMVFIGNPASAGVGLNMLGYDVENPDNSEKHVGHVVYFSCNWSAVDRIQSEDRAHRRGTRCNVQYTDLIIPGTIDEEIRNRVQGKRTMALSIQDIKDILDNVLRSY
jgi:SNF2 family DNA or RNA helicase